MWPSAAVWGLVRPETNTQDQSSVKASPVDHQALCACGRPVSWTRRHTEYDQHGFAIKTTEEVLCAVCRPLWSLRQNRDVGDCYNRGCGPDHCEYPDCKGKDDV